MQATHRNETHTIIVRDSHLHEAIDRREDVTVGRDMVHEIQQARHHFVCKVAFRNRICLQSCRVCVCVCVCLRARMCVCVCARVRACVCVVIKSASQCIRASVVVHWFSSDTIMHFMSLHLHTRAAGAPLRATSIRVHLCVPAFVCASTQARLRCPHELRQDPHALRGRHAQTAAGTPEARQAYE